MKGIAELLNNTLGPVKEDLQGLNAKLTEFSTKTSKDIDELKSEVAQTDNKAEDALAIAKVAQSSVDTLRADMEKMSVDVKEIRQGIRSNSHNADSGQTSISAVIGGLSDLESLQAAEEWLKVEFTKLKAPMPLDVYIKGDTFNGIVFAKFPGPKALDNVISAVRKNSLSYRGTLVWAKADQPIAIRAPLKLLFGLKRLMTSQDWGYSKQSIKIDDAAMTMSVSGKPILEVSSHGPRRCLAAKMVEGRVEILGSIPE